MKKKKLHMTAVSEFQLGIARIVSFFLVLWNVYLFIYFLSEVAKNKDNSTYSFSLFLLGIIVCTFFLWLLKISLSAISNIKEGLVFIEATSDAKLESECILEEAKKKADHILEKAENTLKNAQLEAASILKRAEAERLQILQEEQRELIARVDLSQIDLMSGKEFENYVAKILTQKNFLVNHTGGPGDLGVDLIAEKDGKKIAIQAKRYSNPVSRRAVSDAVAGRFYYNCTSAMVITTANFTEGAVELAQSANCELIDREKLSDWIQEVKNIENSLPWTKIETCPNCNNSIYIVQNQITFYCKNCGSAYEVEIIDDRVNFKKLN